MENKVKVCVENLNVHYGEKQALFDVCMDINQNEITALIGPSGCGKSTFLRCLNRMNDVIDICKVEGSIKIDGQNIYDKDIQVEKLRESRDGISKTQSISKVNIRKCSLWPKNSWSSKDKTELEEIVHTSLKKAAIFDEVKDRLDETGTSLSGGQQQRLCIARAISVNPDVILMDEPCSALDPIATAKIEALMEDLKKEYTIIIVTHSMQQAARVSKKTGFFHLGNLIEVNDTETIFSTPANDKTLDYVTGRFG